MEAAVIEHLKAKSVDEAIVDQIGCDFNLAPFMARTHFERVKSYFAAYLEGEADVGQITFLAISADSPPGQPVTACRRVPVCLTLDRADDLDALREGVAANLWLDESKLEGYEQADCGWVDTKDRIGGDSRAGYGGVCHQRDAGPQLFSADP